LRFVSVLPCLPQFSRQFLANPLESSLHRSATVLQAIRDIHDTETLNSKLHDFLFVWAKPFD
jgi:hypothetical protein